MGQIIGTNRKAHHEYHILERFEAGIALTGTEVKSLRGAHVQMGEGWVEITQEGEAVLREVSISPYRYGTYANHLEKRPRKLLLHKKELQTLAEKIQEKGLTVVPLKFYFKEQWVKVEIGVAKGKKEYDKRASTKEREARVEMERSLRSRNRG